MSANIEAYREISPGEVDGTNTDLKLAALPAAEYVNTSLSHHEQMEEFKALFYLDFVEAYPTQGQTEDAADREWGLIGGVLIRTVDPNGVEISGESDNARHHNLSTTVNTAEKPSRRSREARHTKLTDGNVKEFVLLNDAGLNTMPGVEVVFDLYYANYIRVNITVRSAYYAPTTALSVLEALVGDISPLFNTIASKQTGTFVATAKDIDSLGYTNGEESTVTASVTNEEGTYSKPVTKKLQKKIIYTEVITVFDTLPEDSTYFDEMPASHIDTKYMYAEEKAYFDNVPQHSNQNNQPKPYIYSSLYMDRGSGHAPCYFLLTPPEVDPHEGALLKFFQITSLGEVQYYHLRNIYVRPKFLNIRIFPGSRNIQEGNNVWESRIEIVNGLSNVAKVTLELASNRDNYPSSVVDVVPGGAKNNNIIFWEKYGSVPTTGGPREFTLNFTSHQYGGYQGLYKKHFLCKKVNQAETGQVSAYLIRFYDRNGNSITVKEDTPADIGFDNVRGISHNLFNVIG